MGDVNLGPSSASIAYNAYKFEVYRNSALNSAGSFTKVTFDTKVYDTSANFDAVTNNRFTAPVSGFYSFSWMVAFTQAQAGNNGVAALYTNGSITAWGNEVATGGGSGGSITVSAASGDFFEIFGSVSGTAALGVGSAPIKTWFSGYLVSRA